LPHYAALAGRDAGMRLTAPQDGQTTCTNGSVTVALSMRPFSATEHSDLVDRRLGGCARRRQPRCAGAVFDQPIDRAKRQDLGGEREQLRRVGIASP
jgi:hypothetical protein